MRANDEAKPINTVDVIVRFKGIEDATTLLFAFIVICMFRDLCIYYDSIYHAPATVHHTA
jgi:hypothetical protein